MAIQKVQRATDFEITKHRVHVELDAASNFVIIVDEPPNRAAQTIDTIDKDITVLEIATGLSVAEIQGTPSGFTPFVPDHPNLDKSDIFIWSGEVFIVEYNSTNKIPSNCISITGYQFQSTEEVIVVIDRDNKTIRVGS